MVGPHTVVAATVLAASTYVAESVARERRPYDAVHAPQNPKCERRSERVDVARAKHASAAAPGSVYFDEQYLRRANAR